MSSTVGTYERLRVQDQRSLETLKEELEKRLLTDSPSSSVLSPTSAAAVVASRSRPRARLPPIGANEEEEEEDDVIDDGNNMK